jgi:hypothetical protein
MSYKRLTKAQLIEILVDRDEQIIKFTSYDYTTTMSYYRLTKATLIEILVNRDEQIQLLHQELQEENMKLKMKLEIFQQTHKEIRQMVVDQMREFLIEEEGECPTRINTEGEVVTTILPTGEKVKTMA